MASCCLAGFALQLLVIFLAAAVRQFLLAAFVAGEQRAWKAFVADLAPRAASAKNSTRQGVVVIGGRSHFSANGSQDYTLDALLSIAALRHTGCSLPVELWHDHDPELSGDIGVQAASALSAAGGPVLLRDVTEVLGGSNLTGYMLSTFVLVHSSFELLLYIDADNLAIADPTPLFAAPEFTETGALFWPDPQIFEEAGLIWRVLGCSSSSIPARAIENGQMLINSTRHRRSLELANFFNQRWAAQYFRPPLFLFGDRDMYVYAWLALSAPFSVAPLVGLGGSLTDGDGFCGHSYLQFHPRRPEEVLFLHRTFAKPSLHRDGSDPRVTATKRLTGFARDRLAPENCSAHRHEHPIHQGHRMIDFDVDVDNSSAARETLARLARVEEDMMALRAAIADDAGLRPQWWRPWAESARRGLRS